MRQNSRSFALRRRHLRPLDLHSASKDEARRPRMARAGANDWPAPLPLEDPNLAQQAGLVENAEELAHLATLDRHHDVTGDDDRPLRCWDAEERPGVSTPEHEAHEHFVF